MKIYGNWGLFYSKIPNDLAARALSSDAGVSRADYFDAGLTQPVPDGVLALGTTSHFLQQGVSADVIDPDVKSSYVNECWPDSNSRRRRAERRRALHPSLHSARARGRAAIPDRRQRSRHSRRHSVDFTLTNPVGGHADGGRSRRELREAGPSIRRDRGHRRQTVGE